MLYEYEKYVKYEIISEKYENTNEYELNGIKVWNACQNREPVCHEYEMYKYILEVWKTLEIVWKVVILVW